jgi:prepilin-type N-terminal cleavage/methylation domain-containing protein
MPQHAKTAFTLAELLIALAILGVIATFSIPKVLQSQQNNQKQAIFKEIISAFINIQQSSLRDGYSYTNFYDSQNAVKHCDIGDATSCWTQPEVSVPFPISGFSYGYVLHNGATAMYTSLALSGGAPAGTQDYEFVEVDWNGPTGPNVIGDDQVILIGCLTQPKCTKTTFAGNTAVRYGTYESVNSSAANKALYQQIFAN